MPPRPYFPKDIEANCCSNIGEIQEHQVNFRRVYPEHIKGIADQ